VKSFATTALKIFVLSVVALLPPTILAAIWWPAALSIVTFGAIVGIVAALGRGFAVGAKFAFIFAFAATIGTWVADQPFLAALVVAMMSVLVAFFANRGLAGPMMFAALLVPYVIHSAIGGQPRQGFAANEFLFLLATFLILLAAGFYAALVVSALIKMPSDAQVPDLPTLGQSVLYGGLLAVTTGAITFAALTWFSGTLWMWLTLTIYVLTKPTCDLDYAKIWARLGGTLVGSALAAALVAVIELPGVFYLIAVLLLVSALTLKVESKPYWLYASLLTPAVILIDSVGNDGSVVVGERLGFTIAGVVIALAMGVVMNLIARWYAGYEMAGSGGAVGRTNLPSSDLAA
jgi:hypothetical protein